MEEECKNESSGAKKGVVNQLNKNNLFQDYEDDVPDEIVASIHEVNKIRSNKQESKVDPSIRKLSPMLGNPEVS